jgi:hypothetical protein
MRWLRSGKFLGEKSWTASLPKSLVPEFQIEIRKHLSYSGSIFELLVWDGDGEPILRKSYLDLGSAKFYAERFVEDRLQRMQGSYR